MVVTSSTPPTVNRSEIRGEIRALESQLVEWRRCFHQRPELGFTEHLTSAFVSQKLQEWGIKHQTGIAQTGIVATIESDRNGPVLAIRADIDRKSVV